VTGRHLCLNLLQALAWMALFIVSSLDHRFAGSKVPLALAAGGDLLVGASLLLVFAVFRENSFASAAIAVEDRQCVVSTGPYARVRHPMYAGVLLGFLGVPLALGSWWGLLVVLPLLWTIVGRVFEEEKLLAAALAGYAEYLERTRYRLLPGVW